uniref:Reverse transcriptase domain-containing protein n=1 Tax=Cannabis sativa TaxID=3483 RepID=A0A803Q2V3_CANSA
MLDSGSDDDAVEQLLSFVSNHLGDLDIQMLDEPFTSDEVKAVLFQMAGDKAPGLDGVNALFYQKNWKSGKSGWVALKLDMEKIFDRVEWGFVKAIMQHLHFPVRFIGLTLNCISSVSFRLLINGSLTNKFSSSRGLRQGDPLSPYIFLLVSEALSAAIRLKEHNRLFQGISICRLAPVISHLLFANDSLLFSTTTTRSCLAIKNALDLYHRATGLDNKPFISKYLGIPQCFGRSKKDHFSFILPKASSKMNYWTNRFFSKAGKEVLLKAFWWGSIGNKGKVHWKSWEKLCQSKCSDGLGFRSFVHHNQTLLAKQAWHVFSMPNSLLACLLKAKYFKQNSFLEAPKGHCPSFTWCSLLWGRDLLKRGLLWKVSGLLQDFDDAQNFHAHTGPQVFSSCSIGNSTPIMPEPGFYKSNVDVALSDQKHKVGIGAAVTNSKGDIVAAMSSFFMAICPPYWRKQKPCFGLYIGASVIHESRDHNVISHNLAKAALRL